MLSFGFRRLMFVALPVVAFTLSPVAFDGGKIQVNEACADGTCCRELFSLCNIGGDDNPDRYKKACDGPCAKACPEPE